MGRALSKCFVISPIGDEGTTVRKDADNVLKYIIKPALESEGIEVIRSDGLDEPGRISDQMFRLLLESDLCVAVLTGANPNVYYELAVAQCAARPVILLIEEGEALPFDVADLRTVSYDLRDVDGLLDEKYAQKVRQQVASLAGAKPTKSLFEQFPYGPQPADTTSADAHRILDYGRARDFDVSDHKVVLLTGSIRHAKDIDVVVNSENTDMQMARYAERGISAMLRYLDADRDEGGTVGRGGDHLQLALEEEIDRLGIALPVKLGSVIATETHGLRERGFKWVLHAATNSGDIGQGYRFATDLNVCIRNVYRRFDQLAEQDEELTTLLIPLIGAGGAGIHPADAARDLLRAVRSVVPHTRCQTTYLIAHRQGHLDAYLSAAKELMDVPSDP